MKVKLGLCDRIQIVFNSLPGTDVATRKFADGSVLSRVGSNWLLTYEGLCVAAFDTVACVVYSIKDAEVSWPLDLEKQARFAKAYKHISELAPISVRVHENMVLLATKEGSGVAIRKTPKTYDCSQISKPTGKEIKAYREVSVREHYKNILANSTREMCDSDGRPA